MRFYMRFLRFLDSNYEFFIIKTVYDRFFLPVPIIYFNFHSLIIKLGDLSSIFPGSWFVRFLGKKS